MQPSAKVIADSISETGDRLTTLEVVMHRFVLAEFNTHRVFSRNSASSRAIPVQKQIAKVMIDPAMPIEWGKNQSGMQAEEKLNEAEITSAKNNWLVARDQAVASAKQLSEIGVHKQITNRLLEPFMWHTAIVTFTEWDNFETQRCSPLAQPEIQAVAYAMRDARNNSKPKIVLNTHWHLPYIQLEDWDNGRTSVDKLKMISVARCARVSYLTHDGKRDIQEDLNMYDRLVSASPPHMSPFEHVASPATNFAGSFTKGNLKGWHQLRHLVFGS